MSARHLSYTIFCLRIMEIISIDKLLVACSFPDWNAGQVRRSSVRFLARAIAFVMDALASDHASEASKDDAPHDDDRTTPVTPIKIGRAHV